MAPGRAQPAVLAVIRWYAGARAAIGTAAVTPAPDLATSTQLSTRRRYWLCRRRSDQNPHPHIYRAALSPARGVQGAMQISIYVAAEQRVDSFHRTQTMASASRSNDRSGLRSRFLHLPYDLRSGVSGIQTTDSLSAETQRSNRRSIYVVFYCIWKCELPDIPTLPFERRLFAGQNHHDTRFPALFSASTLADSRRNSNGTN